MVKINKNCGIYKITSFTGKIYIGQAVNVKRRWSEYKHLSNCKGQIGLYNSLVKHGVENHQFDIIEYCSEEDLNCSERFWQDEFDVLGKNGLNCVLQECGEAKRVISEETKEKLSQNNRLKGTRGLTKHSIKVIDVSNGTIYLSVKEASDCLNLPYKSLCEKLNGSVFNNTTIHYLREYLEGSVSLKINTHNRKVIDILTKEEYVSIKEAAKKLNINHGTLGGWLNGDYPNKTNLRFLEEIVKQKKEIRKVIDNNSGIVYKNAIEASKESGINQSTLIHWLKGDYPNKSTLTYYRE